MPTEIHKTRSATIPAARPAEAGTPGPRPTPSPVPAGRRHFAVPALRLPREEDPAPPYRRMIVMSAWAALLTLVGLAVAGRAFLATLFTPGLPGWFLPVVVVIGLTGVALTALAFATVQHPRLPWLLLPGATAALTAALLLTAAATA